MLQTEAAAPAAARINLIGHVARDDRVAAALKTARDNIVKFDPKRLASVRALAPVHERDAASARQRRVKRKLDAARDTLKRVAHIKPPSRMSGELKHRTAEYARVAPEASSRASRRQGETTPPSANTIESLSYRFNVLRAAVPEAMGEMLADLRNELRRENDGLRRELDVIRRELDMQNG